MILYIDIINKILAGGTILLQAIIVLILINIIFLRKEHNPFLFFLKNKTLILGFIIGLSAFLLSLFYSEYIGYPACNLCWIQRVLIYPQLILFGVALYKNEDVIIDYSLIFAILASITSIYHIYVENGGTRGIACASLSPENTTGVSCAVRYIYEFNYITMPIMALTLSVFIIVILLNYKLAIKNKK